MDSIFLDKAREEKGYESKTTFWTDFSIAEPFGIVAVEETFKNALKNFGDNYIFMTELAIVTNDKLWALYHSKPELAKCYETLWKKIDSYMFEHFEGDYEAIKYYLSTTD